MILVQAASSFFRPKTEPAYYALRRHVWLSHLVAHLNSSSSKSSQTETVFCFWVTPTPSHSPRTFSRIVQRSTKAIALKIVLSGLSMRPLVDIKTDIKTDIRTGFRPGLITSVSLWSVWSFSQSLADRSRKAVWLRLILPLPPARLALEFFSNPQFLHFSATAATFPKDHILIKTAPTKMISTNFQFSNFPKWALDKTLFQPRCFLSPSCSLSSSPATLRPIEKRLKLKNSFWKTSGLRITHRF